MGTFTPDLLELLLLHNNSSLHCLQVWSCSGPKPTKIKNTLGPLPRRVVQPHTHTPFELRSSWDPVLVKTSEIHSFSYHLLPTSWPSFLNFYASTLPCQISLTSRWICSVINMKAGKDHSLKGADVGNRSVSWCLWWLA